MNVTWIIETIVAIAVLCIGVRSVCYGIYEWKNNRAGAILMMLTTALMLCLCAGSIFW